MPIQRRFRAPVLTACLLLTAPTVVCSEPPAIEQVGGEIYVYEFARGPAGAVEPLDAGTQEAMAEALETRTDPTGARGISVSFNQAGQLQIAVPGDDQALRAEVRLLATSTGRMEFLILANWRDHEELIEMAQDGKERIVSKDGTVVGRWVKAVRQSPEGQWTMTTAADEVVFRSGKTGEPVEFSADEIQRMGGRAHVQDHILRERGLQDLEVLVIVDEEPALNFQGKHLASVSAELDEVGQACLGFATTARGAKILAAVTSTNLPDRTTGFRRRLGIIFDDQLISAPAIMSTIKDRGRITGNFTKDEVRLLVAILKAGELPAVLCKEPLRTIVVEP